MVKWDHCCAPFEEGGLGLKNFICLIKPFYVSWHGRLLVILVLCFLSSEADFFLHLRSLVLLFLLPYGLLSEIVMRICKIIVIGWLVPIPSSVFSLIIGWALALLIESLFHLLNLSTFMLRSLMFFMGILGIFLLLSFILTLILRRIFIDWCSLMMMIIIFAAILLRVLCLVRVLIIIFVLQCLKWHGPKMFGATIFLHQDLFYLENSS